MNRPGHTRRGFLCSMGAAASAWTLSGCAPGPAPGAAAPADVGVDRTTLTGDVEGFDTSLVLLGTAGGPGYWPGRTGIASVLRVGDRRYLVDAGTSTVRRMGQAAIRSADLTAAFVTHMHSDHIADLFGLFWLDVRWYQGAAPRGPVPVYGPGPVDGGATSAMSGVGELLAALRAAYGHEIAVRNADAGRPVDFATVVEGRAVVVPPEVRASPPPTWSRSPCTRTTTSG